MSDVSKVLVYGAVGGVGEAAATLLHEQGAQLHLVARDESALAELALHLSASYTVGDVTDPALFSRCVADAATPLSGLIFAVGTLDLKPLARVSTEDLVRDFTINAASAALAVQAALPAMKQAEGGASVVLFSSIAASTGFPFHTSISMAKGAIEGLTVALASELAPAIRVNAIAPSLTDTPLAASLVGNERLAKTIANQHPLKRLGTVSDLAEAAAFLVSERSGWISGQVIPVDGARSTVAQGG